MLFKPKLARLTDEELMQKIGRGSEAALTELYQRYSASLLRYFTRMLWSNRAMAEDFLHDLFLKIIHNPHQFDTARKFSTWVYSVAHNMCKNEYRKNENRILLAKDETPYHNYDLDREMDLTSANNRITLLLETLNEEDKTIFLLRYEDELSIQEISQVVFMPEGTVKSRLFYLRKQLATELNQYRIVLKEKSV
ncbi:MAG: sigma-70 family RNA polymerase sigma factor [Cyclobacteriaceae bacterium]|nr:sigma-70 family RNA polymerase sigma factor [Cyclobacteriaceae bacterium]